MIHIMFGHKMKQTQMFTEDGKRIPVTVISAGPMWITEVKDMKDGKQIQLAYGNTKNSNKPMQGIIKKAGLEDKKPRFLRSINLPGGDDVSVGQEINVDTVFAVGDKLHVTGVSKGKGFAGVMKRHGFHGGPKTHGQSDRARAPGSIGQTTTPGRVYKGKRMAGRMGGENITVKGLTVISLDKDTNTMMVKGLVPGGKNGLLTIKKVV